MNKAIEIDGPEGEYPEVDKLVLVQFDDDSYGLRCVQFDVHGADWYDENNNSDDSELEPVRWWSLPADQPLTHIQSDLKKMAEGLLFYRNCMNHMAKANGLTEMVGEGFGHDAYKLAKHYTEGE